VVLVVGERATELTHSGQDKDASISPDGNWVIFVRQDPSIILDRMPGKGPSTSIWVIRADGAHERVLLQEGASTPEVGYYGNYAVPQFLSDSERFVFWSQQAAVTGIVRKSDMTTGKVELVCDGKTLEVILGGTYNDHLIVQKHKYFLGAGSYDWYWLVDAEGTEIGPIGESDFAVELFKEDYAGLEPSESR
jgi:hypothetical protein